MKKELLYNKKSRELLIKELEEEPFQRLTTSFYRYVKIKNPVELRDTLYEEWSKLKIFGRIYIANEGINAQLSCPEQNWRLFNKKLNHRLFLKDIPKKLAIVDGRSFFKLIIKVKDEIVTYGISESEFDMNNVGKHLSPEEFNSALNRPKSVVVDMRNYYESEVGRFDGAIIPDVETSRELLPEMKRLLIGKENDEILMYCTGGIRCEKASAYLIHHGFKNVNQLNGGIINYAHNVKEKNLESKFLGKNFVFDARIGERITNDVISECHQCGEPADNHIDCCNDACHILFIQCDACKKKYEGCCSKDCREFARLPKEEQRVLRKDPKRVVSTARKSDRVKPRLGEI